MKFVMIVLLAVVSAASKIIAASDTLWIDSYRVINTCSGEQRWVFSVWIGEVYFSDSLMSFDITIGYDTAHLRPTNGLWLGTLADKMRFADISPYINLVVPGEIRVGAFTITTPVKGNEPLFAVTGDYKGTCTDRDTFSLPFSPTFNEEFKGEIIQFRTDTVVAVAVPLNVNTQGTVFVDEADTLRGRDSTTTANFEMYILEIPSKVFTLDVTLTSPLPSTIDSLTFRNGIAVDSIVYDVDRLRAKAYLNNPVTDSIKGTVYLRSATDDTVGAKLILETVALDSCLCKKPALKDTIRIYNVRQPIVTVETDVYDDFGITFIQNIDGILIQNHHGQPGTINVINVLGNNLSTTTLGVTKTWLSLDSLPRGVYYIVVVVPGRTQVKKIEL